MLEDDERKLPDEFFEKIIDELRRLARLVRWRGGVSDTLQTGVLISQIFLKFKNHPELAELDEKNRRGIIINALKQIVIDHSRKTSARVEGGAYVPLEELPGKRFDDGFEAYLTYKPILAELKKLNPRQAEVFALHFEEGLTFDEIAVKLHISKPTAERDWRTAKAFWATKIKRKGAK